MVNENENVVVPFVILVALLFRLQALAFAEQPGTYVSQK
jgi:hypothetical protein